MRNKVSECGICGGSMRPFSMASLQAQNSYSYPEIFSGTAISSMNLPPLAKTFILLGLLVLSITMVPSVPAIEAVLNPSQQTELWITASTPPSRVMEMVSLMSTPSSERTHCDSIFSIGLSHTILTKLRGYNPMSRRVPPHSSGRVTRGRCITPWDRVALI